MELNHIYFLFKIGFINQYTSIMIIMCTISVLYFIFNSSSTNLIERICVSIHGILGTILYTGAIYLFEIKNSNKYLLSIYHTLLLLPVLSIIYSFFKFKGKKIIHFLQILNVICLIIVWFFGSLLIIRYT